MTGEELKILLLYNKVVLSNLASKMSMSQQAFSNRLKAAQVKTSFIESIINSLGRNLKPVSISLSYMGDNNKLDMEENQGIDYYKNKVGQLEKLLIEKDITISEKNNSIKRLIELLGRNGNNEEIDSSSDCIVLTDQLIQDISTDRGGYTKQQLSLLGIDWPPKKGWKKECIGKQINRNVYERLLYLKTHK